VKTDSEQPYLPFSGGPAGRSRFAGFVVVPVDARTRSWMTSTSKRLAVPAEVALHAVLVAVRMDLHHDRLGPLADVVLGLDLVADLELVGGGRRGRRHSDQGGGAHHERERQAQGRGGGSADGDHPLPIDSATSST